MGCFHSKKESSDLHPNVFRVVNIDENGVDLCSGQLEITDSDIILYREGRESTIWPLHSLRRYGFEGEIFSFESGRRCETGEGIYAFRCRRASLLFRTLQQQIQFRNVIHETTPYPVSRLTGTPSPQGRQTLQASVVHRSSIDMANGQSENIGGLNNNLNNIPNNIAHGEVTRNATQVMSPRSPSSVDILEVMPLYPRSQVTSNHVTNVYQVRDFKREHNNNQSEPSTEPNHVYCNDLSRDLAVLRNSLRQERAFNLKDDEDDDCFFEGRYINGSITKNNINNCLSPTLSNCSEHYAQLSVEQETSRLYMNIGTSDYNSTERRKSDAPGTPVKPVDYCNLSLGHKAENNMYANLSLGDVADNSRMKKKLHLKGPVLDSHLKFSESDTITSMSPVEDLEVNYAVLDIEINNKEALKAARELVSPDSPSCNSSKNESTASGVSQSRGQLTSQISLEKSVTMTAVGMTQSGNIGYTTIDFDKTVALTSVAAGSDGALEGPRKTRHNSTNMCGSPIISDKNKSNNG